MKRKYVLLGLALIAALAIASPVFGLSKSVRSAIKKEVARQIGKAAGPVGQPGAPGSAIAYAFVNGATPMNTDTVNDALSKNITDANVTHPSDGVWCFNLGFTVKNAVASPRAGGTVLAVRGIDDDSANCPGNESFEVLEQSFGGGTFVLFNEAFVVAIN